MKAGYLCASSVLALAISIGATQASAAEAPPTPASVSEVVVTGSFIRGTPEDAALPVDVIGADELQKQGSPSPVELMKSLTVSNGVLGDTNQFDARAQGSEGSAHHQPARPRPGADAGAVERPPPGQRTDAERRLADINVLPFAAIGRIEVLKDGAAATYGSDAIAGVVNFITRKNTEGVEVTGSYKYIDGADGTNGDWDAQAVGGIPTTTSASF